MRTQRYLGEALDRLNRLRRRLSPQDEHLLTSALLNICIMLEKVPGSQRQGRPRDLELLLKYTARKSQKQQTKEEPSVESLASLRNRIAHGEVDIRSSTEFRRNSSAFWQILERHADYWQPRELANLLAYSMETSRPDFDPMEAGPVRVIKFYKALFNTLSPERQRQSLRILVLRVFSEPSFRRAVEREERTR